MGYAPVVQYESSFLIVGGYDESDRPLDTVIRYTEEGEWETLPTRLTTARYRHTALAVTIACALSDDEVLEEETSAPTTTSTSITTPIDDAQEIAEVAEELEKLGITSEYRVSLAWESTADLDIYVKNVETNETIDWRRKESGDGNTILDADNIGGSLPEDGKKHVENISFNGTVTGTFAVYVNNHRSNSDVVEIPFAVVTKVGDQTQTFEKSWNINEMGENRGGDLGKMMKITTINIAG